MDTGDRSAVHSEFGPVSMALGGVLVGETPIKMEDIYTRIEHRMHMASIMYKRIQSPIPYLLPPVWVDEVGFNYHDHLTVIDTDEEWTHEKIEALYSKEIRHPLPAGRPPWHATLIPNAAPYAGMVAILRGHHAFGDGRAMLLIAAMLFDGMAPEVDAAPPQLPTFNKYDRKSHIKSIANDLVKKVRGEYNDEEILNEPSGEEPRGIVGKTLKFVSESRRLASSINAAPATPINPKSHGVGRNAALFTMPIEQIRAVGKAKGGTINDALLTVVSASIREQFENQGAELPEDLIALVPMDADTGNQLVGNRFTSGLVELPIAVSDDEERFARIHERTRTLKGSAEGTTSAMLIGLTGLPVPVLAGAAARVIGKMRSFNIVISNVPGLPIAQSLVGSTLREIFPIIPLNPQNQGLNFAVLSYRTNMCCVVTAADEIGISAVDVRDSMLRTVERLTPEGFDLAAAEAEASNNWGHVVQGV